MKYLAYILSLVLISGMANMAQAQCCAAGNPDSDDNLTAGGGKNKLLISLGYRYSYSDQYYEGSEPIDYTYIEDSDFDFTSLSLTYGVSNKLRFTADIGYFFSKAQTFDFRPDRNAYGLADGSLTAIYKLLTHEKSKLSLFPIAKVTLPIGTFDQIQDDVVLPIDLQPSSGSYRYNGGLMLYKKFSNPKLSGNIIGTTEYSQRINTERTNYKYGNLHNISIAAAYAATKKLNFRLQSRYQIRQRASSSSGDLINATGGQVIFIAPQISYDIFNFWKLATIFEYPVYKNMHGRQLTNKYMVSVKLSRKLDFNKNDSCNVPMDIGDKYIETSFKVKGTCESCKAKIEKICLEQKGIYYANWVVETKILTIRHAENFNLDRLKKKLTKAGHEPLKD